MLRSGILLPSREEMEEKKDLTDCENYLFLTNRYCSEPDGLTFQQLIQKLKGDFDRLEEWHGYIQWIFPTIEVSRFNRHAFPLREGEIQLIRKSPLARKNLLIALNMMMEFYGLNFTEPSQDQNQSMKKSWNDCYGLDDTKVLLVSQVVLFTRASSWPERSSAWFDESHNFLRITRIIESLCHMDLFSYAFGLLVFFLYESKKSRLPTNLFKSFKTYWIPAFAAFKHPEFSVQQLKKIYDSFV